MQIDPSGAMSVKNVAYLPDSTWIMHTISGRSMARLAEAGRV
jgi:hypothetical protein